MSLITFIDSPTPEQIKPIVDGVIAYGKNEVGDNTPEKYAFHLTLNEELIGGVVGAKQYQRFYLSHIWVEESYRNQGWGSKLLSHVETTLKHYDCHSVILETLNQKAVQFYTQHGYAEVSCIKEYVQGFDLVHMLKTI